MISLPKEKTLKYFWHFSLLIIGLLILFGSLVITSLKIMAEDKNMDNLRKVPIEYVKKMENGEKILKSYKVPESKIGPDNGQYLIKKIRDNLWINLTKESKNKSEICLLIADKKIFESAELVKNNKEKELVAKTLKEAIFYLKESRRQLLKENGKDIEINKIDQKINEAGLAYEDIVKSFDCNDEKINKIIDEIEDWNKKNIKKEKEK